MPDILVTGGTGQVGTDLSRLSWPDDVYIHTPPRAEFDLCSAESIGAFFQGKRFAAVINCAAYTAVDRAESDSAAAFLVNSQGPAWLAEATRNAKIPLIHLSTDYVFDGSKTTAYSEDDETVPLGVYGASKRAGELAVISGNPRSIVLRTAWVLSAHGSNFLKTMLRLARSNAEVRVVADQVGCPTSATDIAIALQTMVLRMIEDSSAPHGIYHFVNAGETSWCGLAQEIFAVSEEAGGPSAVVTAITSAEYPTAARRPANSRLRTEKLQRDYGTRPREWQSAVRDIVQELLEPQK